MSRFCGSPTRVATPPSAVPTSACITRLRRKARKRSRSPRCGSLHQLVVVVVVVVVEVRPDAKRWYTEYKPVATAMITAMTVSASRNAESTAAATTNVSESSSFERTATSSFVKTTTAARA